MAELLDAVKKLGLNEYESKAYLALLSNNSASASSISKVSLIPRARVYDVLTSLEKKGFIERKLSKPVEYAAFPPFHVAKNIGRQRKDSIEQEINEILEVGKSLEQQSPKAVDRGNSGDEVRLVKGQENIYLKISNELENSNDCVLFYSSASGIERKKAQFKRKLDSLAKKGVKVSFRQQHQQQQASSELRYCVIDKKTLILFLNKDPVKKEDETALIIKNPFLAGQFFKK